MSVTDGAAGAASATSAVWLNVCVCMTSAARGAVATDAPKARVRANAAATARRSIHAIGNVPRRIGTSKYR